MASDATAENNASKHACAECRIKKIRCIRSPDGAVVCDRCARTGKVCQVPASKKRAPKSRMRHRLDKLEDHYSEILNLLSTNTRPDIQASVAASQSTPVSGTSSRSATCKCAHHVADVRPVQEDAVDTLSLTSAEAEALLDSYRHMSEAYFPYVLIPKSCTVCSLQMEKPMLLQAILIVASWKDHTYQSALQSDFLKQLGDKLLIQEEKSLDMLQALLVYCSWYHFYATQGVRPAYRFAALAVTIALELGIDRKPTATTQHDMILNSTPSSTELHDPSTTKSWSHEASRAFLGAYSLSSFCKVRYGIPSPLQFTPYTEQCALALSEDAQYPSDAQLIHHARAMRLTAEISDTFDNGSTERESELDDEKIHHLVRALERRYADWRSSLPAAAPTNVQVGYNANLVSAYLHEVGLYGMLQGQTPSPIRISIMFTCLANVEGYIADVLALTVDDMAPWTTMDWRPLNYGVMLAARIALTLNAAAPNSESSARLEKIAGWLDEFISRTRRIRSMMRGGGQFFAQLCEAWEGIRSCLRSVWERAGTQAHPAQTKSAGTGGIEDMNSTQSAMAWSQGQDMPWTGFENEDLWAADASWLRIQFGAAEGF